MTKRKNESKRLSNPLMIDTKEDISASNPTAKVFSFLELLSRFGSARLTDLAIELDLPKTTLFRITSQLEELGYIQREPGGKKYSIAPRLISLASNLFAAAARLAPRHEILEQLARSLGESCSLGTKIGHSIVYVDDVIAESPLAFKFETGVKTPLYCTSSGKLFLAYMKPLELNRYFKSVTLSAHTSSTIVDENELRKALKEIKKTNFASSKEEFVVGVVGAAVPVVTMKNEVVAALAVSMPVARMNFHDLPALRPQLMNAAKKLGYTFS